MSIAAKISRASQMLNDWVKNSELDSSRRAGIPTEMAEKMKALDRKNRELRQANEILRRAPAHFAMAEFGRRSKWRSDSSTTIEGNTGSSRSARCY